MKFLKYVGGLLIVLTLFIILVLAAPGDPTKFLNASGNATAFVGGNLGIGNFTGALFTQTANVLSLSAADCDVKSYTNGTIYCGIDGGGTGGGNITSQGLAGYHAYFFNNTLINSSSFIEYTDQVYSSKDFNVSRIHITSLSAASCDVKSYTNGTLYCGTDSAGGSSPVNGSGTLNYLAKWFSASEIGDSGLIDNGSLVTVGSGTTGFIYDNGNLNITGNFSGTLFWGNLSSYPSACSAENYVSTIDDTLTCGIPSGTTNAHLHAVANLSDKNNLALTHTHTVANLTDNNNLALTHTHDAANTTTGLFDTARIPTINNTHTHAVANLTDKENLANTHTLSALNITAGNLSLTSGFINISGTDMCLYLPGGGRLCGNSTCSILYSPNSLTVMEACN